MTFIYNNTKLIWKTTGWLILCCLLQVPAAFALQYSWHKGTVSLTLPAPVGQLLAVNQGVNGSIDDQTGMMQFDVAVADFRFVTEALPDYINTATTKRFKTYYLEAEKFPLATIKGKITDIQKVNFAKEGTYPITLKGTITIHGTTKQITKTASIIVQAGKVMLKAAFDIPINDYQVRVPEVIAGTFFNQVDILVDAQLKP